MSAVEFNRPGEFHKVLYARVRAHLATLGEPTTGGSRIAAKTLFIFALFLSSYVSLVFLADSVWLTIVSAIALSQAIVLIGFNVMHDAGHRSFSQRPWVNRMMGLSLDLIGGNQFLWNFKHGTLHHTYTNITEFDDDLDSGGLIRMHPDQPWRPHHHFQLFYTLFLYSLLYIFWFAKDFIEFFTRRVGPHPTKKPTKRETAMLVVFKINFLVWALVVPMLYHEWYWVLLVFVSIQALVGMILSLVFQLAHVVDGVSMPSLNEGTLTIDDQWAAHQIRTTADFAVHNPLLRWYAGGLNLQVEHHLFPGISHVRYRHIQPVVAQTCAEFGIPYRCYPTVRAALMAHVRQIVAMSRRPEPALESA